MQGGSNWPMGALWASDFFGAERRGQEKNRKFRHYEDRDGVLKISTISRADANVTKIKTTGISFRKEKVIPGGLSGKRLDRSGTISQEGGSSRGKPSTLLEARETEKVRSPSKGGWASKKTTCADRGFKRQTRERENSPSNLNGITQTIQASRERDSYS